MIVFLSVKCLLTFLWMICSHIYSFEPLAHAGPSRHENQETSSISLASRGNTDWCLCGRCHSMDTEEENKCCFEIPEEYFKGKQCITETGSFSHICLLEEVLKTTLYGLNNLRGDTIHLCNRSLRYAAYRMFTWWVHNRLGRGVRKVIPSCAIWDIRNAFPESDNTHYVPYQEVRDELDAWLDLCNTLYIFLIYLIYFLMLFYPSSPGFPIQYFQSYLP